MAQFTFADEDAQPSPPATVPPQATPPPAAPSSATSTPEPSTNAPVAPSDGFTFVLEEETAPAPVAAPTPAITPQVAPPVAPTPQPPLPKPPAPSIPATSASKQQAPSAPTMRAPQAPAPPQVLGGARPAAPAASDNPVRDAAKQAAQAPDRGASAGMVNGAIPNVAGPRPPSPPQPNQVSNPPTSASANPPVAPQPPVPPAAPTTARQAAAVQAAADRAAKQASKTATAPQPPVVHAATPGMSAATTNIITPDVNMSPSWNWRAELDKLDPILGWLFRVGAIFSVLSLGYILLGLFGGAGSEEALRDPATRTKALQFSRDILLASRIFQWSLLVTAVTTLLIALDVAAAGPIVAGIGFLMHFGAPIALARMGATPAILNVTAVMRTAGMILLVLGLLKYSVDFFAWLKELPNRARARADIGSSHKAEAKQQQEAKYANMFSPCWQLPFCREVIRKQCPAFLARQRCWKFGRGCYCDEEMIGRIIRGESLEKIKAPTQMSNRKPPCNRCHIFIEHQALKYKVMAPLAVPATVGLMFVGWDTFTKAFLGLNDRMNALWGSLSVSRPNIMDVPDDITKAANLAATEAAERTSQYGLWIFGILLGFFLLIYISKFIEWAVLEKKL